MSCDNKRECACTYSCSRHGKCCQCIEYHRRSGELPGCYFSKAGEATYDRSVENYIRDSGKKRC